MLDVIIAGAGPAGAVAAIVLARTGARVLIVDREEFPRDKLCGDTLNPGALELIASLQIGDLPAETIPLAGMIVSGPGAVVRAEYRQGVIGRAISRRVFDQWLLERAIATGARFEPGLTVQGPLVFEASGVTDVRGLVLRDRAGKITRMPAVVTIAADGRKSVIAREMGLSRHPAKPRRWAYGTYASGASGASGWFGEMHVRAGWYAGVAPMPDGRVNVCVVTESSEMAAKPLELIKNTLYRDQRLRARFERATFDAPVHVLGPLAVDVSSAGAPGLFLAGDAAGFVDPMTGDGLNLAMRGAILAAEQALRVLESSDWEGAVERLNRQREEVLGPKLRFNRRLRALTGSPIGVRAAGIGAWVAPTWVERLILTAGDAA